MTTTTSTAPAEPAPAEPAPTKAADRSRQSGALLTLLAVVLALIIGGIIIGFSNDAVRRDLGYFFAAPGDFFADFWTTVRNAYVALFTGAIFNPHNNGTLSGILGPISASIFSAVPLICGGLSVSLAFRAGLFNIGGEGQVAAGAFCSGLVGFAWPLPPVIHLIVAIIAGLAGGAFWGFIAGWLKARTGAHEVITTIMLNYVAQFALLWLLATSFVVSPSNPQTSRTIANNARLPQLLGSNLSINLGLLLALAAAAGMAWFLKRSTPGFRLRAVGANPAAARTAGMSVGGATMLAMALAGALAGLGGTVLALGGATSYVVTPNIASNVGFDAITVALLGRTSPWGTVFAGLLFGVLHQGGTTMQATSGVAVPVDIVTIIQALIVIFVAAPRLVHAVVPLKTLARTAMSTATTNLTVTVETIRRTRVPRHYFAGGIQTVLGALALVGLALSGRAGGQAMLRFGLRGDAVNLGSWTFGVRPYAVVLCVLVVAFGVLRMLQLVSARVAVIVSIAGLLITFVLWSIAGTGNAFLVTSLLQGALFPAAIPLILGALAGIIGERAGVVNVAIEGQLLFGAFVTAVAGTVAGSVWAGLLGGAIAGLALGAVLAVLAIRYLVDQVIIGVVLNVLALGVTSFFFNKLLAPNASEFNQPGYFSIIKVPLLSKIPVIGDVFFSGTIFLYGTYVLVALVHFGLFHTRWGLRLRAVGEHPKAADTVGINVLRTRYRAVLVAGVIAGLGGAFLVIGTGQAGTFQLNMSNGQGFIALAAVIFGRWSPKGAVLAALLFGFADQLQSLLAQVGAPIDPNLLLTLPYVVTLFAVAGFVGRVRAPAADGQPYRVG